MVKKKLSIIINHASAVRNGAQPIALARPLMQDLLTDNGAVHDKAAGNVAGGSAWQGAS